MEKFPEKVLSGESWRKKGLFEDSAVAPLEVPWVTPDRCC